MLRMVDRIDAFVPDGGRSGSGLRRRHEARSIPTSWFFQAHFYQDPVWPGSLGLESFLQLLKYVGVEALGRAAGRRLADGRPEPAARVDLPRPGAADGPRSDGAGWK